MPRKQRRRAWGSITEATKGKKYVLRWVENTSRGRRRCSETFYGTYREASARLDQIHVERKNDTPIPTISKAYETWLVPSMQAAVDSGTLARNTRELVLRSWRNYVGPRWGDCTLDKLVPLELQEWLLTLPAATADTALLTLRKVYSSTSGLIQLPFDPFSASIKYRLPTRKSRERIKGTYAYREASQIADALRGNRLEPGFIAACFGSCRSGESLGIKACEVERHEIDFRTFASFEVVRQMEGSGTQPAPDGSLKTEHSNRIVVIPPPFSERLLDIAVMRMESGSEWLCDRGDGLPLNRGAVNRSWRLFCEDNDIRFLPWSNLRQSWRTIMGVELQMPWEMLEMMMGHALPGVSGRHYIRPSRKQIVQSFADAFPRHLG